MKMSNLPSHFHYHRMSCAEANLSHIAESQTLSSSTYKVTFLSVHVDKLFLVSLLAVLDRKENIARGCVI